MMVYVEGVVIGGQQFGMLFQCWIEFEMFDWGLVVYCQYFGQVLIFVVDDKLFMCGYGMYQMVELVLDCGYVWEDVGVVVFKVVEDGYQWLVVYEFVVFVEEGCVVFIGFDYEFVVLVYVGGDIEIFGDIVDQEVW